MTALRRLWVTIMTPSARDEDGYLWALIFLGHAMIGAALGDLLSPTAAMVRLMIGGGYWLIKERRDLKQNGRLLDGIADAAAVAAGAWLDHQGVALMLLATACIGATIKESRKHG